MTGFKYKEDRQKENDSQDILNIDNENGSVISDQPAECKVVA